MPSSISSYAPYTSIAYARDGSVQNVVDYAGGSAPSDGFSWIADQVPHPRGAFTGCEHMKLRHDPSLPGSPTKNAATYENKDVAAAQYPRTYVPHTNWYWRQSHRFVYDKLPRSPLENPWYPTIVGSLQVSNAIAGLKARISRLGLGRAGLAESVGELPDTPNLFKAVSLSKGLVGNASSAFLCTQFGWRPLLDLIEPVRDELHRFRSGLRASRRQGVGRRAFCFSTTVSDTDPFSLREPWGSRWPEYPYTMLDFTCEQLSSLTKVQYMVMADVRRKPYAPAVADYVGSVDGLFNLRTIWELIPNSFLVDYFIGVGDYISRLQGNLLYDVSMVSEAWALTHKSAYKSGFYQAGAFSLCATDEISYYYRSTALPVLSCLPEFKWPKATVIPTSVALGLQRYSKYLDKLLLAKRSGSSLSRLLRYSPSWLPQGGIMKQRPNMRHYLPRR